MRHSHTIFRNMNLLILHDIVMNQVKPVSIIMFLSSTTIARMIKEC